MGKQGPCYHCGVTSTPLWRNGPPDKPVLCNACGSRWRTKGTLKNYTPLHSRGPLETEDFKVSKPKCAYFRNEEQTLYRKRQGVNIVEDEYKVTSFNQNFGKCYDEDFSNWSTSSSAISYTESCSHIGSADSSNAAGIVQTSILDSSMPSTKRTSNGRLNPSPVEKLTKELRSILHQQMPYLSRLQEEDLLYDNESSKDSFEIGHGGVLIRHLNSEVPEEESEASSLPTENKTSYSIPSFSVHTQTSNTSNLDHEKIESARVTQEHITRNKLSQEKVNFLQKRDSHMGFIELKDAKHEDNPGGTAKGEKFDGCSITASRKRPHASQPQIFPEPKVLVRSPRRVQKTGVTGLPSITKSIEDAKDHEGSCFSPGSMFTSSECTSSLTSLQYHAGNLYQELLIDVHPSTSFPEAELLSDIWKQKTDSKGISAESGVSQVE